MQEARESVQMFVNEDISGLSSGQRRRAAGTLRMMEFGALKLELDHRQITELGLGSPALKVKCSVKYFILKSNHETLLCIYATQLPVLINHNY